MSIIVSALVFQIISALVFLIIILRKWFNACVTQQLVLWLTTSQFILSHEATSGHPQVQVTVASARVFPASAQMMCWMRAY